MAPANPKRKSPVKKRKSPVKQSPTLRDQVLEHELKLLKLADQSDRAEIREYAMECVRDDREHLRKQEARQEAKISPRGVLFFCLPLCVAAVAGCWYSLLHFKPPLNWEINEVIGVVLIVAIVLCLTVSKHLPISEAVKFFRSAFDWFTSKKSNNSLEDEDQPIQPN